MGSALRVLCPRHRGALITEEITLITKEKDSRAKSETPETLPTATV